MLRVHSSFGSALSYCLFQLFLDVLLELFEKIMFLISSVIRFSKNDFLKELCSLKTKQETSLCTFSLERR